MNDAERMARELIEAWERRYGFLHLGWQQSLIDAIAVALREARRAAIEQAVLAVEKHDFLEECRLGVCDHGMGLPACLAAAVHAIVTLRGEGRPNA